MSHHHPSFRFIAVGSMPDQSPDFNTIGTPYFTILERMGGERVNDTATGTSPLVYFILTGGTEQKVLLRLTHLQQTDDTPLILVAHPGNNSLPASLEILAKLHQAGRRGQIIYLSSPDDTQGLEKLANLLTILDAHVKMKTSRIGLVGKPSDWLIASMPEYSLLKKIWGPHIEDVNFDKFFNEVLWIDSSDNEKSILEFIQHASIIDGPGKIDFKKSIDIYTALQQIVKENNLNAISLRCFDLVTRHQSTGCYALSQLNDDKVVAGCEGDLVSTVGILWARDLLQQPAWMANPARIDQKNNRLWLAHCTIAIGMTRKYDLLTHFETDLGIGIRGEVSPQPCTIFRIGGKDMKKIWIAEGNILTSGNSNNLCRTQLEISLDNPDAITQLLENPLGNHVILVFGHHLKMFMQYHQLCVE